MSRFSLPLCTALPLFLSTPALAQGWFEYSNEADYFGVNLPAEPVVDEFMWQSDFIAAYPARRYTVEVDGDIYITTVVDFTNSKQIHEDMDNPAAASGPTNWIYAERASVATAAREFRERGSEVTYDAWSHLDRVEGHQIQLTNPDGSRPYAGIYLNANRHRLVVVEATVAAGSRPPIMSQQSLHFLDDEGQRIRYLLSTNGCVVDPTDPRIEELSVQ